jgi:hypothetical protein
VVGDEELWVPRWRFALGRPAGARFFSLLCEAGVPFDASGQWLATWERPMGLGVEYNPILGLRCVIAAPPVFQTVAVMHCLADYPAYLIFPRSSIHLVPQKQRKKKKKKAAVWEGPWR